MLKYASLAIALAAAAAIGMPSSGEEPSCGTGPAACASGRARSACGCGNVCCPQCGCHEGLVPVCHEYWTTKKVTKYCYKCVCEEICLPGPCGACNDGFLCHLGCKDNGSPGCAASCGSKDCGCKDNCGSGGCNAGCGECRHCKYREVHHLVKCPVTTEVCVRKCRIDWVCPHCHCDCGCTPDQEMPSAAPGNPPTTAPMPPAPPALAPPALAPPTLAPPALGKTTATDRALPQASTAQPTTGIMPLEQ